MLKIVKRNIENELRNQFRGKVKLSLYEDTLIVDIITDKLHFHTVRPNMCGLINRGVTSHELALDIGAEYMSFFLERFLK